MTDGDGSRIVEAPNDPDRDEFPTAEEGLTRILEQAQLPDGPIEYLECSFLASGEATWRVREPRAEDMEGGYLPPA